MPLDMCELRPTALLGLHHGAVGTVSLGVVRPAAVTGNSVAAIKFRAPIRRAHGQAMIDSSLAADVRLKCRRM